jgi:hypothetical protein
MMARIVLNNAVCNAFGRFLIPPAAGFEMTRLSHWIFEKFVMIGCWKISQSLLPVIMIEQ